MISSNGTAVYNGAAASYGPHRMKKDEGDELFEDEDIQDNLKEPGQPIGDAVLPLMLCACAFLIIRARKRAKGEKANG